MLDKSRRIWNWTTVLVILGLLLAACVAPGAQAPAAPAGGQAAAAPSGGRPLPADAADDQTIHYVTRNFDWMNPATEGGFGRPFVSHIWMPFFIRDHDNKVHPWLATGYDVSQDGKVYTIHIDPRAIWSDGSPVTAKDAIDFWTYAVSPKCKGCWVSYLTGFQLIDGLQAVIDGKAESAAGLVAVDDKTLKVTLTAPNPIFIDNLAHYNTGFTKLEDVLKGENFAADGSARVNGPFKIKVWDKDEKKYEVEQNPKWWGDVKPYIQHVIAQESADENVSFIMWQNNEVDIAHWLTNIREPLRAKEPDTFHLIPYATNFFFPFWTTIAPMDDINVRKALVHAVDWDAAIHAAWEGARDKRVMKTHLTPELACFKADNWPDLKYDPALAKQELAASKYGSADKLPLIRISTGGQSPNYIRTAEIMIEQWKKNLGLTQVEVRPGPLDAWGQDADKVQVHRSSWGATIPSSSDMIAGLYKWASDPKGVGLTDPELDKLVTELRSLPATDPTYCSKVQAAEAKLLGNYYFLPMIWDLYEYNVKPYVKNFDTNVDNNWSNLLEMYVAKH